MFTSQAQTCIMSLTLNDLAKMIDHSLLHPTMTDSDLRSGLELCKKYNVATACVKPYAIPLAREILGDSSVSICAVIGFPHGNSTTAIKVLEAEQAVTAGATEIDMVINIGKALGGDWEYVQTEIQQVNEAIVRHGATLKVIFENDYLSDTRVMLEDAKTRGFSEAKKEVKIEVYDSLGGGY